MAHKILIIDDDEYIRDLYEEILKDAKFNVDSAVDGKDGLEKIEKNTYDLVLLDVMMPKMDGLDVLKNLAEKKMKVNIVLLTNLSHGPVIEEGKKLGAMAYLIKADLTPDQLVEKVKSYLK
ncbi:hypothetical protein A3H80_03905 [Candidatus Roizmanbacteria bacterium RIFCSPLOWO2_02_FULL_37_19]|uniref:Response regulatory domain-containing protein n=1 Tax=Candidatus Roizmanbacteria bacterium RIFCSPHIGHO2_02_FULL_37_24 TaxID=1802037 RepID=A0A1F7GWF2_9BACT|nr:MAG: hypothetical protein A2862_03865 [Candidatus Roizmanbacteria bacterium RIFCSPHIGHO2_01_FULL_38_41]OGK23309.1 MAG: hypothetical protein A3C24_03895 [Candidatus Roizmanbacteria bacterium RIFCSPHIGHO2_02_FULL_37_24]OGK32322.1 MAG: hypothetical protein A3E10_04135 [Candidatus Roizmanbacteria bacterium RIFCSPHIGHO2_12_FULL_37_23]OGK44654.1 MAG: hypothetical protein A2956_03810 [Candidatus Roizmanbacteria bacterium RIFCSPLOWO2_01_FULL_37_57]OGK54840.1 MAG: hypothetical protein A3H80_03905 [Ca